MFLDFLKEIYKKNNLTNGECPGGMCNHAQNKNKIKAMGNIWAAYRYLDIFDISS